ncbi:hypothetical protein KKB18_00170 [bacterium]|nr:hypothetical protein [bacterium]
MVEKVVQQDKDKEELEEHTENQGWEFGWKFHRGPILIAAILTIIFYLSILIFVK